MSTKKICNSKLFLLYRLHKTIIEINKRKEGGIVANYLYKKYRGKFRVKSDYDLSTNDFPRDEQGNIDSSFDDFYIPCANKSKIRHYEQNILFYYCPSIGRFRNILKKIYEDKVGSIDKFTIVKKSKELDKKDNVSYNYEPLYQELLDKKILVYIEEYDSEGEFRFKTDMMDYIAEIVKPNTSGSNISPFSTKNLPSVKYDIPEKDLKKYQQIIKTLDKGEYILLTRWIRQFDNTIQSKKGDTYDVNAERKLSCLSGKEFIHSIGLFDAYLKFLEEQMLIYQKEKNVS